MTWTLRYADGGVNGIITSGDGVDGPLLASDCPLFYLYVNAVYYRGRPFLHRFGVDGRESVDAEGLLGVCCVLAWMWMRARTT